MTTPRAGPGPQPPALHRLPRGDRQDAPEGNAAGLEATGAVKTTWWSWHQPTRDGGYLVLIVYADGRCTTSQYPAAGGDPTSVKRWEPGPQLVAYLTEAGWISIPVRAMRPNPGPVEAS